MSVNTYWPLEATRLVLLYEVVLFDTEIATELGAMSSLLTVTCPTIRPEDRVMVISRGVVVTVRSMISVWVTKPSDV